MAQRLLTITFRDGAAFDRATELFYELFPEGFVAEDPRLIQAHIEQDDWDSHEYDPAILEDAELVLQVYLPETEAEAMAQDLQARLAALSQEDGLEAGDLQMEKVPEEDWDTAWQDAFEVLHYGERIQVVPDWLEPEEDGGDVVIRINPGLAFGTGSHETTGLCLELLEEMLEEGMTVFDIGCGSGILAVAACLLGADRVDAVDRDPQALRSAAVLGAANDAAIMIYESDLLENVHGQGDIVLANIVPEAVIAIFDDLRSHLAPAGYFIASGIRSERGMDVTEAGQAAGFALVDEREQEGWLAQVFTAKEGTDGVL